MLLLPNQHKVHFHHYYQYHIAMMGSEITCFNPALSRRSQFRSLASLCLPYTKPPLGQFKAWFTLNISPSASQRGGKFLGILPYLRAMESQNSSAFIQNSFSVVVIPKATQNNDVPTFFVWFFCGNLKGILKEKEYHCSIIFHHFSFFVIAARIVESCCARSKFDPLIIA
jgi:hypothetical protein